MIKLTYVLTAILALPLAGQLPQIFFRPTSPIIQAGASLTFTFSYPGTFYGGALINISNANNDQPNSCLLKFTLADQSLSLLDDAAGTWSEPVIVGSARTLNNSQCLIDAQKSSVTLGNDGYNVVTTTAVAVTFRKSGNYSSFVTVLGFGGRRSIDPWRQVGTVLVLPSTAPVVVRPIVTRDSEEAAFLVLINTFRSQNGAGPLRIDAQLQDSSHWMSADMATHNYFSHTDSLGRDAGSRIAAFGYPTATSWWGENIAAGNADAQNTFTQWLNACDPDGAGACTYAHRLNMLNPNFSIIGIARAFGPSSRYGWYWVTDFGAR